MNTKMYSKVVAGVLAVAIAAVGIFAMPTATYAQGTNPPTTPSAPGAKKPENPGKAFEKLYERAQKNLDALKSSLSKANEVVTKAQSWIDEAKGKGIDTSTAEAALATYKAEIAKAQASYDSAKSILDTHAGFDANGKVTDREQALKTVKDFSEALREGRQTLAKATREFQKVVKEIRAENRNKVKPTTTPTP